MEEVEFNNYGDTRPQVFGCDSTGLRHRPCSEIETTSNWSSNLQQLPLTARERAWCLLLAIISAADILSSTAIVWIAFTHAYRDNGVSLCCLGFQSLSHLLSSVILVLRFGDEVSLHHKSEPSHSLLRERRRSYLTREQGLTIFMAMVMMISSGALLFKAARKFKFWNKWYRDHVLMDNEIQATTQMLAWWGFGQYTVQTIVRSLAARKLQRRLVWHSVIISFVSLLFLLVMGVAASYEREWSWKADPIAAMLLSFLTLAESVRIIVMHIDDMDMRLDDDPRA